MRFNQFTDELKTYTLNDLFNAKTGNGLSKEDLTDDGQFECILYGELFTTYNETITTIKSKTDSEKGVLSKYGDILIPISTTTTGRDLVVASVILKDDVKLGSDMTILRKKKDIVDEIYFAYYFTYILPKEISKYAQGITIVHLAWKYFKNTKITIPSLNEQKKISAFISSIDVKLKLLKDKKDEYVKFKHYLLQNLFPQNGETVPKLRFKQFIEEWKTYLLKDLGCLYRGHSYNSSNVVESGLLVLRSNNIQNNKLNFDEKELQFVNKACKKEINLKTNDIVICMSNGTKSLVGKTAQYNGEYDGDITVGAFCSIFRSENILSKYIFQIESFKRYLYILLAGTNINNIKNSDLEKFQVVLPSIKEQEEIASFLSSVDKKIDLLNQEIEQVEEYKKGLLQKMFIWRVYLFYCCILSSEYP